jgi:hypothetical protein
MRSIVLAAVIAVSGVSAAQAAPTIASVSVAIGPELQAKAADYGQRDLDALAADLKRIVERATANGNQVGAAGAQLRLVLADAKPNRPTFAQLGHTPGLSMESFGTGGARIEGELVSADGTSQPVGYSWYETDIRQSRYQTTWGDADLTFDRFADRVAHGKIHAER